MSNRSPRFGFTSSIVVTVLFATACSPTDRSGGAAAAAPASSPPAVAPATERGSSNGGDPCGLLTLADVQRALPHAAPGRRDRSLDKDGILRCEWTSPGGRAILLASDEPDEHAIDEAKTWAMGFVDPMQSAAEGRVRFERLTGIGDEAIAVVEAEDRANGFLQSAAYVVVRRGQRQVSFMAPALAQSDRRAALATLSVLGAAIAARLE